MQICYELHRIFTFSGLIDYNFHCFRTAIQEVFELKEQSKKKSLKYSDDVPMGNGGYLNGQMTWAVPLLVRFIAQPQLPLALCVRVQLLAMQAR